MNTAEHHPTARSEAEQEIEKLYGRPLEEFTQARNELARRFRAEGQRAIAARIGELKKPSVSAWTVNQLARGRPLDVQRLVKAGERLREAHLQALAGKSADDFSDARKDEQRALRQLSEAAQELLRSAGHSATVLDRVMSTLRAAAATEEGRELLKAGQLTVDLESQGFDALLGVPLEPKAKPVTKTRRRAPEAKRSAVKHAEKRQVERRAERRQALSQARADVQRLRQQAREARQRATRAQREADEAEKALAGAKTRVREADDALSAAESELAEAEARLARIVEDR